MTQIYFQTCQNFTEELGKVAKKDNLYIIEQPGHGPYNGLGYTTNTTKTKNFKTHNITIMAERCIAFLGRYTSDTQQSATITKDLRTALEKYSYKVQRRNAKIWWVKILRFFGYTPKGHEQILRLLPTLDTNIKKLDEQINKQKILKFYDHFLSFKNFLNQIEGAEYVIYKNDSPTFPFDTTTPLEQLRTLRNEISKLKTELYTLNKDSLYREVNEYIGQLDTAISKRVEYFKIHPSVKMMQEYNTIKQEIEQINNKLYTLYNDAIQKVPSWPDNTNFSPIYRETKITMKQARDDNYQIFNFGEKYSCISRPEYTRLNNLYQNIKKNQASLLSNLNNAIIEEQKERDKELCSIPCQKTWAKQFSTLGCTNLQQLKENAAGNTNLLESIAAIETANKQSNPCLILGLSQNPQNEKEIRTAYRKLCQKVHPDKNIKHKTTANTVYNITTAAKEWLITNSAKD